MSSPPPLRMPLPAGTLRLRVGRADLPLEELVGFACRKSRKRGFVFVSKVLGKHYPVRPGVMADTHLRLARKLASSAAGLPGPAVVVALAETATGLGQGLFEQFAGLTGRDDLLFLHTTRYRLPFPLAFPFEESHSHATRHLLYLPARREDEALFRAARSLVLIDDEISTGRTLANLARKYLGLNSGLEALHLVCLTDWLGEEGRDRLRRELGVRTDFHHLLSGTFAFEEDPRFDPGPIPAVDGRGDDKSYCLPDPGPRVGVREILPASSIRIRDRPETTSKGWDQGVGPASRRSPSGPDRRDAGPTELIPGRLLSIFAPAPGRILVLGTGEFAHPPFRLALDLERRGYDVFFQSTTRSPLLVGGALESVLEFVDNYHDDIPNYLYNVAGRAYDQILVGYETSPLPAGHRLAELLGAEVLSF